MDPVVALRIRAHLAEIEKILDSQEPDPPDNVSAIRPDEVELEGIIGRPELKEVRGKTLWTAGLGVKEGEATQWYSLSSWGSAAEAASTIQRGQVVRVVGKLKDVQYVNDQGTLCSKKQLTVSLISPVVFVGSASTG